EIAAVPGFDALLFGPGDFSHLIGKVAQVKLPEVVAARKRVAEAARKHGKYVVTAGMFESREALAAEGVQIFTLGADVIGIGEYFKRLVADFHKAAPAAKTEAVYR
ncbi:MAG: aldolase, partial [Verrucomicrobia bacterium]|nr:aldolase [Verrucomicrobiota bacterium]